MAIAMNDTTHARKYSRKDARKARFAAQGLLLTLLCGFILACGPRPVGYGVVFWSPEASEFITGDVVPIVKESQINDNYTLFNRETKVEELYPRWRVLSFEKEQDALEYKADYAPWLASYAYSARRNLPVREESNQEAQALAKLLENQVVKILSRNAEKSREGEYENYWYQVLTPDGIRGYSYGEYLVVFESDDDPVAMAQKLQARDSLLDSVLNRTWRPEYYQDMIGENRFDLSRFVPAYGFYPSSEENSLRIISEDGSLDFEYDGIRKIGDGFYFFDGAEVRLRVMRTNRILISYSAEGKSVSEVFVHLTRDVSTIITEEKERRQALFDIFVDREFISQAYGKILFSEGMRFTWDGFEKLLPFLSNQAIRRVGRVGFPFYLGKALSQEYDGAIALYFETVVPSGEERAVFLYRLAGTGVGFTLISPPDKLTIAEKGVSPLVLFFSSE